MKKFLCWLLTASLLLALCACAPDAPPEGGPPPLLRIHDLFTEGSQFVHHLPGTSWYHDRVRCKTRHISSLSLFSKHGKPPG